MLIFAAENEFGTMLSKRIEAIVGCMPADGVFTYRDFNLPPSMTANVIRKLNRMAAAGVIAKLSKGRYYKPRQTVFGALKPRQEEIVKDLLVKDGKTVGYLTGYSVFNQMGLTTQISNVIEIGSNVRRNKTRRGNYDIRFTLQPNPIRSADIPLFQFLDAVRRIKAIPDTSVNDAYVRLRCLVREMDEKSIRRLVVLALGYSPMTRALTGALLDSVVGNDVAWPLYVTLNSVTSYKVGVHSGGAELAKWRIV